MCVCVCACACACVCGVWCVCVVCVCVVSWLCCGDVEVARLHLRARALQRHVPSSSRSRTSLDLVSQEGGVWHVGVWQVWWGGVWFVYMVGCGVVCVYGGCGMCDMVGGWLV